eukprot:11227764-Heterocapsa_arctica.AAC.1
MVEKPELWGPTLLAAHLMTGDMDIFVDDKKFGHFLRDVGTDVGDLLVDHGGQDQGRHRARHS